MRPPLPKRPVFLFGNPRSGTTLLYRMIQRHPLFKPTGLVSRSGVHLVESHFFQRYDNDLQYKNKIKFLINDHLLYTEFLRRTRFARRVQKLFSSHDRIFYSSWSQASRTWIYKLSGSASIARTYFSIAQRARGAERLIEKTPGHVRRLPEIVAAFPDAQFIFLIRHPIDTFSSYRRRSTIEDAEWLHPSIPQFIERYSRGVRIAKAWKKHHPSQMYILTFEDLTSDPETHLKDLCAFLKIKYHDDMLTFEERVEPRIYDPLLVGPIVPSQTTKRWQDFVTEAEAQEIERKLMPIMKEFGYKPYSAVRF